MANPSIDGLTLTQILKMTHSEKVKKLIENLRRRYADTSVVSYLEGMLLTNFSEDVSKMVDVHLDCSNDWLAEHGSRKNEQY
jgi:hypothetical protein